MGQDGQVKVTPVSPQPAVRFELTFTGFSSLVARTLVIRQDGMPIGTIEVPTHQVSLSVPLRLSTWSSTLEFDASPGPQPLGNGDDRVTSIYFENLTIAPVSVDLAPNEGSLR